MTLTGTIRFEDLEGGVWLFVADGGGRYLLAGGDRKIKKDGARAEVDGSVEDGPGLQMVGPVLNVRRYRFL